MIYLPTKPVVDVRDYGLDWGPVLAKVGNPTITDSVWTKLHGAAMDSDSPLADTDQIVYVRISGGAPNTETVFRNTVTFSNGQVWSADVFLRTRA